MQLGGINRIPTPSQPPAKMGPGKGMRLSSWTEAGSPAFPAEGGRGQQGSFLFQKKKKQICALGLRSEPEQHLSQPVKAGTPGAPAGSGQPANGAVGGGPSSSVGRQVQFVSVLRPLPLPAQRLGAEDRRKGRPRAQLGRSHFSRASQGPVPPLSWGTLLRTPT